MPRKCEPPDPPLDYFIPDPEPEATFPPPQRLDYIEETCIKLNYICSSSLRKYKMSIHMILLLLIEVVMKVKSYNIIFI